MIKGAATLALAACALAISGDIGSAAGGSRPPLPSGGREVEPGQIPRPCTTDEIGVQGYYFSDTGQQWVAAPLCYGKWGNLDASASQIVAPGVSVTVTAIPTDGSNSGTYAPQTGSIHWEYPGQLVSGCGAADLSCTVIPVKTATSEWQWLEFHVSMPRTFFIDSPGDLCGGQHLCAGAQTNAWSYVGIPPVGAAPPGTVAGGVTGQSPSSAGAIAATLAILAAAAAVVAKSRGGGNKQSIGDIQRQHTGDSGSNDAKSSGAKSAKRGGGKIAPPGVPHAAGAKSSGGKAAGSGQPKRSGSGRRGATVPGRTSGRPGKVSSR